MLSPYRKPNGFTLIELMVVIAIIGLLSGIVVINLTQTMERSRLTLALTQLKEFERALWFYMSDHGDQYPADVNRGIPAGMEDYLNTAHWPEEYPWPGCEYDWDNWDIPSGEPGYPGKIIQLSIRFCPLNQPENCRFPHASWAADFDYYSAVYWCIEGPCRSHSSKPIDHPGYCVNCH